MGSPAVENPVAQTACVCHEPRSRTGRRCPAFFVVPRDVTCNSDCSCERGRPAGRNLLFHEISDSRCGQRAPLSPRSIQLETPQLAAERGMLNQAMAT